MLIFATAAAIHSQGTANSRANGNLRELVEGTRALIEQGEIKLALQNLTIIQKQSSNNAEAKFALGELFQELAGLRAEQLQRVAPNSAAAHELLGKSLEAQGKLEEARVEYRQALEKSPATAGLHFLLGNIEWKLRNIEGAAGELSQELKLNPHHAMANLRMGQIELDTHRDEPIRALAFLKEAASDAQSSVEAHRELGKALRLARRYPEAVKELQLVASRAPHDDTVHAQLAALYKDTGDRERARQEMEIHARILREKLQASQKAREDQAHQ